jgi:hypothetical protein
VSRICRSPSGASIRLVFRKINHTVNHMSSSGRIVIAEPSDQEVIGGILNTLS